MEQDGIELERTKDTKEGEGGEGRRRVGEKIVRREEISNY